MEYRGPQDADYDNVRALNRTWLGLLGDAPRARRLLAGLPAALAERCVGLRSLQRERLARTPFLLLSFREDDTGRWAAMFEGLDGRGRSLFAGSPPQDAAEAGLTHAALGFVWQLARLNPYAARLICGASLHWCEQIAERPLIEVVVTASCGELLVPRRAGDTCLWRKLLYEATAADRAVRDAARISALQRVLTAGQEPGTGRRSLAARRLAAPGMQVADDGDR